MQSANIVPSVVRPAGRGLNIGLWTAQIVLAWRRLGS
jgi:hypothetical protein